jgi:lysophospholipase L1-like esterase
VRLRRICASVVVAVAALATTVATAPSGGAETVHYYLALGDSLSRGYMPGVGDTDQGYADDLYARLHAVDPTLELVKLGCSGETTGTMINGGKCTDRYPAGGPSQLSAAEQFLRNHRGQVTYLTLDIGANDVDGCAPAGSIDLQCVAKGTATIAQNLNTILAGLTAASGRLPRSIGMNYYDPFLEEWLNGPTGQVVAAASVTLLEGINTTESLEYVAYGWRVADVATAFHTLDFLNRRTTAYGVVPQNVAYICNYTYMCSVQNIHANVAGYQLIANAFAKHI